MPRSAREYLHHILDEAQYLANKSREVNRSSFLQDDTLKRAFVRSIEVIGEAVKRLPEPLKAQHAGVEWRSIAAMHDRLIHGYFGVDYEIVWDVAANKAPELAREVELMLARDDL